MNNYGKVCITISTCKFWAVFINLRILRSLEENGYQMRAVKLK